MATIPNFEKARADYHKSAATCDRAWEACRKQWARQRKGPRTFKSEQALIEAREAEGRALDRHNVKHTLLWRASYEEARLRLFGKARASVPFKAPTSFEIGDYQAEVFAEAQRWTPPAPEQTEEAGPLFAVAA
jgi:hypothetical protein